MCFTPDFTSLLRSYLLISVSSLRLLKVRVPDVEFFINVGDWPLESRSSNAVPILSWCGSTDTRDIILPTYEVTHSTLEAMRGVTNDLLSVQGNTGVSHTLDEILVSQQIYGDFFCIITIFIVYNTQ